MKRVGLALILAGGLMLVPAAVWSGSFGAAFRAGSGLRVTARGTAAVPLAAGGLLLLSGAPSMEGFGSPWSGPTYLTVDATPLEAQVFLDGRLLGSAHQLVARAFPLASGRHAIEIVAPGFQPYTAQFAVAPGTFPLRVRVALRPQ